MTSTPGYVKSNLSSSSSSSSSSSDSDSDQNKDSSSSSSSSSHKTNSDLTSTNVPNDSAPKETKTQGSKDPASDGLRPGRGRPSLSIPKVVGHGLKLSIYDSDSVLTSPKKTSPERAKAHDSDSLRRGRGRPPLIKSIVKGVGNELKASRKPKSRPRAPASPPRKVPRHVNNVQTRWTGESETESNNRTVDWRRPLPPKTAKPLTVEDIPKSLYSIQKPEEDSVPIPPPEKEVNLFDETPNPEHLPVPDDVKVILSRGVLPKSAEFEFLYSYGANYKTIAPQTSLWALDKKGTKFTSDVLRERIAAKGRPRRAEVESSVEFDILREYESLLDGQFGPTLVPPEPPASKKVTVAKLKDGAYRVQITGRNGKDGRVILFPKVAVMVEQVSDELVTTMTTRRHRLFSDHPYFKGKLKVLKRKRREIQGPVREPSPGHIRAQQCLKPPTPRFLPDETNVQRALRLAKERYRGKDWESIPKAQEPPKRKPPKPKSKQKVNTLSSLDSGSCHKNKSSRDRPVANGPKGIPASFRGSAVAQIRPGQSLKSHAPLFVQAETANQRAKEKYRGKELDENPKNQGSKVPQQKGNMSSGSRDRQGLGRELSPSKTHARQSSQPLAPRFVRTEIPMQRAIPEAKEKLSEKSSNSKNSKSSVRIGWSIDTLLDPLAPDFENCEERTTNVNSEKEQGKKKHLESKAATVKKPAQGPPLVNTNAADYEDLDVISLSVDEDDSWLHDF